MIAGIGSAIGAGIAARPAASPTTSSAGQPRDDDAKLRDAAIQLEGLFVQQLYMAMRSTVPEQDGIVSGGAGEDIFTGLMDQHLAAETPKHWDSGIAEALYRQLRGTLPTVASPASPSHAP